MIKKILIWMLIVSGLFDTLTFLIPQLYQFEINPIFIYTQNIFLVVLIKFIILASIIYLLLKYRPKNSCIWAYTLCFIVVYVTFFQILGGISNIVVANDYHTSEPGSVVPLESEEAVQSYATLQIIGFYLPMLLAIISFWFFEKIYLPKTII